MARILDKTFESDYQNIDQSRLLEKIEAAINELNIGYSDQCVVRITVDRIDER